MTVYLSDPDATLLHGDALTTLPLLASGVADAVVTSPPYLDQRPDVVLTELDWGALFTELGRVVPSGSLMLNLGRVHRDGVEVTWAHEILDRARESGWLLLDEIIWHKVNGGGGRSSTYLIDRHERVYWLARRVDPYKGFDEARQPYSPATLERYARKWARGGGVVKGHDSEEQDGRSPHPDGAKPGSVFVSSVGADKGIQHPTPMAPELAEFLIKLACPPGGTVLDPFAGSGTTARAARRLGRRSILIEIDEAHCAETARLSTQQALAV